MTVDEKAKELYEEMAITAHPMTMSWEHTSEPVKERWRAAARKVYNPTPEGLQ